MKINIIKEICTACWLTQPELSEFTGIKLQRLKDISSGRVEGFKSDDIAVLVEKLHLNADWLTTGEGDIFKDGYSRSYPSKKQFVSDLLDELVSYARVNFYAPVTDEELELPKGTAASWITQEKIPYWALKKFSEKYGIDIDRVIYGARAYFDQLYKPAILVAGKVEQDSAAISYGELSKRELALLDDFRALTDKEKDAAETMLHAVAKHKVKKQA